MEINYLNIMLNFVEEAGKIALKYMDDSQPGLKEDHSVITKADKAISKLVHEKLHEVLNSDDHILIDEESPDFGQYFDQSLLEKTEYLWAVDPIDGTRNYANQMPVFGISIKARLTGIIT